MMVEDPITFSSSSLIGRGQLQSSRASSCGKHCPSFYIYLVLGDTPLMHAIAFSYGNSLAIAEKCEKAIGKDDGTVMGAETGGTRSKGHLHVQANALPDDD